MTNIDDLMRPVSVAFLDMHRTLRDLEDAIEKSYEALLTATEAAFELADDD